MRGADTDSRGAPEDGACVGAPGVTMESGDIVVDAAAAGAVDVDAGDVDGLHAGGRPALPSSALLWLVLRTAISPSPTAAMVCRWDRGLPTRGLLPLPRDCSCRGLRGDPTRRFSSSPVLLVPVPRSVARGGSTGFVVGEASL